MSQDRRVPMTPSRQEVELTEADADAVIAAASKGEPSIVARLKGNLRVPTAADVERCPKCGSRVIGHHIHINSMTGHARCDDCKTTWPWPPVNPEPLPWPEGDSCGS